MNRSLPAPSATRAHPGLEFDDLEFDDTEFGAVIAGLAARMTSEQRHAFLAKMVEMDRQERRLSPASVTLGRS